MTAAAPEAKGAAHHCLLGASKTCLTAENSGVYLLDAQAARHSHAGSDSAPGSSQIHASFANHSCAVQQCEQ